MSNPNAQSADNKEIRTVRLIRPPHPTQPGEMIIKQTRGQRTEEATYQITLLDSELGGRAFELVKLDDQGDPTDRYSVLVNGSESSYD